MVTVMDLLSFMEVAFHTLLVFKEKYIYMSTPIVHITGVMDGGTGLFFLLFFLLLGN